MTTLYVAFISGVEEGATLPDDLTSYRLGETLFLVESSDTQSRVYHDIKHSLQPDQLFVGALNEPPKFKGMNEGALKWLRER